MKKKLKLLLVIVASAISWIFPPSLVVIGIFATCAVLRGAERTLKSTGWKTPVGQAPKEAVASAVVIPLGVFVLFIFILGMVMYWIEALH